jgi:hypothetical protein
MDPRVTATTEDLRKQFEIQTRLASAVSNSSEAVTQARSIREQTAKRMSSANGGLKSSLTSLDQLLSALLDGNKAESDAAKATLSTTNTDLIALYKAIGGADAAPTVAQVDASNKAESDLSGFLDRWSKARSQISAVNAQLASAGLPTLKLDLPPQEQSGGEDLE